jgi:hypothetical protein
VVRPLLVGDVELDYEAVMASREYLRPWEQTGWPADDFTVEEDLADLEGLEAGHREGRRYTYTVMTPDERECLGCVYLMPPDASSFAPERREQVGDASWDDVTAAVYWWVRTSRLADGLDLRLLDALRRWFAEEWSLAGYVLVTNEQVEQQVALLDGLGLGARFVIRNPGQDGAYLAYA